MVLCSLSRVEKAFFEAKPSGSKTPSLKPTNNRETNLITPRPRPSRLGGKGSVVGAENRGVGCVGVAGEQAKAGSLSNDTALAERFDEEAKKKSLLHAIDFRGSSCSLPTPLVRKLTHDNCTLVGC